MALKVHEFSSSGNKLSTKKNWLEFILMDDIIATQIFKAKNFYLNSEEKLTVLLQSSSVYVIQL